MRQYFTVGSDSLCIVRQLRHDDAVANADTEVAVMGYPRKGLLACCWACCLVNAHLRTLSFETVRLAICLAQLLQHCGHFIELYRYTLLHRSRAGLPDGTLFNFMIRFDQSQTIKGKLL